MEGLTAEQESAIAESKESFVFQAEVNRLMDIIINSLYKNREVFLRELISNASDALDKLRFLAVSASEMLGDLKDLYIQISYNENLKTITIRDTGIGMTKQELINNLGTLAKSGTKKFLDNLSEGADVGLIGQFGVGFYSVYLIADKVRVITKNNEDEQYIWESTAESSFTIAKDPRGNTLGRGTEITMFLKEDALEFLKQDKLEEIIKHHSEFINFPISLYKKTSEVVEVPEEVEDKDTVDEDGLEVEEEKEKKPKTEKVDKWDWHRLNGNVAIWSREKDSITDEEYQKFFKVISKEPSDALTWIHFKAEGEIEFKSILYVPTEANNLYEDYNNRKAGVRLYVRKVLIQEDFEDLLPKYLNFIKGVVDSDDLPLNVSRETLQQHKILKVMSKKIARKVLEMLRKLATGKADTEEDAAEDDEAAKVADFDADHPYMKFFKQFGKSIKMGIIEDTPNRSKLAKLLRYQSSKTGDDKYTSLDNYVARKPEWQKDIYYIAAESLDAAKRSPFLEMATRKGVEVLFLVEPVDEYAVGNLGDFDGMKLQSLTKEGLKFGDEDEDLVKKRLKAYREAFKPLTTYLKELFAGKVGKVVLSQRVETTPSVIVTGQYGHTANMERIMRAQTFANPEAFKSMTASKTLEINPRHPVVVALNKLVKSDPDSQSTKDMAFILLDTALLQSGFQFEETEEFAGRMFRTLASNLKLESLDLEPELAVAPEEEDEEGEDSTAKATGGDEDSHDEF
eukprot:CAMPEP_0170064332 /NCGR_PEP_ID=MMETSP0019_2-20121128/4858_1 /TAXON_ID=98059 /ORGANISM="Dinobryon sp., Strain UTEXLB2267" /LENGTH=739 /DNA_ID=CAMNT_0010270973 /DNA_START=145 /DNA_END=2364 /DNA_ORIENTATION=+